MIPTLEIVLRDFNLQNEDTINIYPYGSRNYHTAGPQSDWDYIVVMRDGIQDRDSLDSSYNDINATIYSESSFLQKLAEHSVSIMECMSVPEENCLKLSKKYPVKIDLAALRASYSAKSSHAWVKAKKKFEVVQDRNVYVAKKSLFHSMRIIDFGIQICKFGKITDMKSCIDLWEEIYTNPSEDWAKYKELYQGRYNSLSSEFRRLAPK